MKIIILLNIHFYNESCFYKVWENLSTRNLTLQVLIYAKRETDFERQNLAFTISENLNLLRPKNYDYFWFVCLRYFSLESSVSLDWFAFVGLLWYMWYGIVLWRFVHSLHHTPKSTCFQKTHQRKNIKK